MARLEGKASLVHLTGIWRFSRGGKHFSPGIASCVFLCVILSLPAIGQPFHLSQTAQYTFPSDINGVDVINDHVLVAGADGTLRVIDIADIANPIEVGSVAGLGSASKIVTYGSYAYVATNAPALAVVDISSLTNPVLVRTITVSHDITSLTVHGTRLYLTRGAGGISVFDLATPANPPLLYGGSTPQAVLSLDVSGNRMYYVDDTQILTAIDITDILHPSYLAQMTLSSKGLDVKLDGRYTFVVSEEGKFDVLHFAWPGVNVLGSCQIPGYSGPPGEFIPATMRVSGDHVLVAERQNGLTVVDISNETSPVVVDGIPLAGTPVAVDSNTRYFFAACGAAGVVVIDARQYLTELRSRADFNTLGTARGVKARNSRLFVADGLWGLRILDFSDPGAPKNVGGLTGIGETWAVDYVDHFAYVACRDQGVALANIANPASPQLVRQISTSGVVSDVLVHGTYLLVAEGAEGVRVFDITDPSNPAPLGFLNTAGTAVGLAALGNSVYVADYDGGITVVDITDPRHPIQAGVFGPGGNVWDVRAANGYLYAVAEDAGLYVIDSSDPAAMSVVGQCVLPGDATGVEPYRAAFSLDVSTDFAFIADGDGGLKVLEIWNPAHPRVVDSAAFSSPCWGVHLDGKYVFAGATQSGVHVFDCQPYSSRLSAVGQTDAPGWGTTRAVRIRGDYLYQSDGGSGLRIIDIHNPENPQIVGHLAPPTPGAWNIYATDFYGDYAYCASREVGVLVVDISNPLLPQLVRIVDTPDAASDIQVSGSRLFVADRSGGIRLYDLTDPASPSFVSEFKAPFSPFSEFMGLDIVGNRVYIAGYWMGLLVVDYTDPVHPYQLGSLFLPPYSLWDVKVDGDHAYVVGEGSGLIIIDCSDPMNMHVVSRAVTPDEGLPPNDLPPFSVMLRGNYAFVGDGPDGLQVIDVSDITAPRVVDSISLPGYMWGLDMKGDHAYLGAFLDGVHVVDVSYYLSLPGGHVSIDTVTPGEAWLFGGVKARISGGGFRADAAVLVDGQEVEPIEVTSTRIVFIVPPLANTGTGNEEYLDVEIEVFNPSSGDVDRDTTSFRYRRYLSAGGVATTAFYTDGTNQVDLLLDAIGDARLSLPIPSGLALTPELAYGIARASKIPANVGSDSIDAGPESAPLADNWDFSIHLYSPTVPGSAYTPEDVGTPVYDEFEDWRYDRGDGLSSGTLRFPVDGTGLLAGDIQSAVTLWSASANFDYAQNEMYNTGALASTYQSTLLTSESTPSVTPSSDPAMAVDTVIARVYDLSAFSLRRGPVELPSSIVSGVHVDAPGGQASGPTTGGTPVSIIAPEGGFGWVEAAFGHYVTDDEPLSAFVQATVTNQGQSEYVVELESPPSIGLDTVDIGLYHRSDLSKPVVVLHDAFHYSAEPPVIIAHPVSATVNPDAIVGFGVSASGTSPLSYQWRKNGANLPGMTGAWLTLVMVNESYEGQYSCSVGNAAGSVVSNPATLTVNDPPSISVHPESRTVNPGAPVGFTVAASGTAPLSYQWRRNGSALSGATQAMYAISSAQDANEGDYTCLISNVAGSAVSNSATLVVTDRPTIVLHPVSKTVNPGSLVEFTVGATGTEPLSYQWRKDGTSLVGATDSIYSIPSATELKEGIYTCLVSNVAGDATSNPAVLVVMNPPSITLNPASQTLNPGSSTTLSVSATGDLPLSYQWKKGGVVIAGATATDYAIVGATESDEGSYTCKVSNAAGNAVSSAATLSVNNPPSISQQPASNTVNPGAGVTLSITADGTEPLSYQWRKNGSVISGATLTSYTMASVKEADEGSYICSVSNMVDTKTSEVATLSVNNPPSISSHPASRTVNPNATVTLSVTATGTTPLSYQWRKGSSGIVGATLADYVISSVKESDEGQYRCLVTNVAGAAQSNPGTLSVNDPPVISTHPASRTIRVGESVEFNVVATGTAPLSYQWKKGASNIPGATVSSYSISPLNQSHSGEYTCVASNMAGTTSSNVATLSVVTGPSITKDPESRTVNPGVSTSFTVEAAGTAPLSFQWRKDTSVIPGATESTYTIGSVKHEDEGTFTCQVSNSVDSVISSAATLTVNHSPMISTHPTPRTVDPGTPVSFVIQATGTAPLSYQWKKGNQAIGGATASIYTISSAQESDEATYSCVVSNVAGAETSSPAALVVNDSPSISQHPSSRTVDPGASVTFSIVVTGSSPLSYQWRKDGSGLSGATSSEYSISNVQQLHEGVYSCLVSNSAGAVFSNGATLSVNDPPVITGHPQSKTVNPNTSVSFTVAVTGSAPLSYQWAKDGVSVGGATGATYAIASVAQSHEGSYACIVTNTAGTQTSSSAALSVNDPPTISTHPVSSTVNPGASVNFGLVASGSWPLTFQWNKNGNAIPGATKSSYSLGDVKESDEGDYSCTVSNMAGTKTSNNARLTVNDKPVITSHPASQTVQTGMAVNFIVAATGTGPLSFQWKKDNGALSGATKGNYSIASAKSTDSGTYVCEVTGVAGTAVSNAGILTISDPPAISTHPQSKTTDPGDSVNFTVSASGTAPLSYQWRKNGAAINGATVALYAIASAAQSHEGSYTCLVSNPVGEKESNAALLTVNDPPAITAHPESRTVNAGAGVSFSVAATGTAPLSYQWRKGPNAITGATSASYAVNAVKRSDAGDYSCTVSNRVDSLASNAASLVVTCSNASVPGDVQASDGTYADRVRVTWTADSGAKRYDVYRSESDDASTAQLIGTAAEGALDDYGADAPRETQASGCAGGTEVTYKRYYYWVKAVNTCDEVSEFSNGDQGWRGQAKSKATESEQRVYQPVLPAELSNAGEFRIDENSILYVRLRDERGIDPATVWGHVSSSDRESIVVEWMPVDDAAEPSDGWVIYRPERPWIVGDTVTVSVGALTLGGEPIEPVTVEFVVEDGGALPTGSVFQPSYSDLDMIGLDLSLEDNNQVVVAEAASATLPELEGGVGIATALGPQQVYDVPQRVWLPLPAGTASEDVSLAYHVSGSGQSGWHPAESVDGWLVPQSYLEIDLGGVTYLGFLVRHAGIVQLQIPAAVSPSVDASQASILPVPSTFHGALGDVFVMISALVMLCGVSRFRYGRQNS